MSSLRDWLTVPLRAAQAAVLALTAVTGAAHAASVPPQVVASKYAAIVVDTANGRVLYEANADARRYPASLTKMMTLYVLFEELERGRFKLSTPLKVSALASRQPPSKLGLRPGETISAEDAIKALVTKSANDAAATIGENVAGSIPAFADRMTRTARAIGMSNTRFRNANGLPDPGQYTTARDLMKLGVALQVRFPSYYAYFQTRTFVWKGRPIGNHNNLLGSVDGVDGIKTGYINASGFNLVTSIKRDGRKLVAVVMGGKTARMRDAHMIQLINTYLPQASRARGYDDDLVAAVRSAPRVAGAPSVAAPQAREEVAQAVSAHPMPQPRPTLSADADDNGEVDVAMVDPATVAPRAAAPEPARAAVVTRSLDAPVPPKAIAVAAPMPKSLAEATLPASLANARLPSSAAEAFADVAPVPRPDPLAQLVAAHDTASLVAPKRQAKVARPQADEADLTTASVQPQTRAGSGWMIQIGAVESRKAAISLLERARSSAGASLASAEPVTETFSKGGQTYVRARFGGFSDEKSATRACAALKKNAFNCFTMRL